MIIDHIETEPPKYPEFSKRIKAARKAKRITQSEMAELIGVDWITYSKIDNGRIFPGYDTLIKINKVLFS